MTGYRVGLARGARRLGEAERLQSARSDWSRQRAAAILAKPLQEWTAPEKNAVRMLAASLHEFSEIQREQGSAKCVDGYLEAISIAEKIQDSQGAATCAFNLGRAYEDPAGIRVVVQFEFPRLRGRALAAK